MSNNIEIRRADVRNSLKPFFLETDEYKEIKDKFYSSMIKGLCVKSRINSSLKMFPSYVTDLPNGTETGQFLALDLGGTNYRVILVTLYGKGLTPKIDERTYAIPKQIMTGDGKTLFEYIAQTLKSFLQRFGIENEKLELGFTFSFPCEQKSIAEAFLVRWTKGFDAKNVINKNVADLLQQAIIQTGLNVTCIAVVNDTVGTLASCALEDKRCAIGLIVGTGTNAAYVENINEVETMNVSEEITSGNVVINMEWGAFGEMNELESYQTIFDKQLDIQSLHPKKQVFEKMVSGMYLGELIRLVLLHLIEKKIIFQGEVPESLKLPNSFSTKYASETERDPPHLFYSTQYILSETLNIPIVEHFDLWAVRKVCEAVTKRAAFLVGAGIAAILQKLDRHKVTIGIDGSLYKFHTKFREHITDIVDKLKPKNTIFCLRLSEDGSGKGAAAIAAAKSSLTNQF